MAEDTVAIRARQEAGWRDEMERLGPGVVRSRFAARIPITDVGPYPDARFVQAWLDGKDREKAALETRTSKATLKWARIAGWSGVIGAAAAAVAAFASIIFPVLEIHAIRPHLLTAGPSIVWLNPP